MPSSFGSRGPFAFAALTMKSVGLAAMEMVLEVQRQFDDATYLKIKDHTYTIKAYGMDYLLGQLSLVLFDIFEPRSYLDNRETLLLLLSQG